jgi:hypothetical protein
LLIGRSAKPRASAFAVAGALAIALAGCGDDGDGGEAKPLGPVQAGSVAPQAQCRDWVKGTEEEKLATIEDIRSQINLESGTVEAPALSDEEAMGVFNNACANDFAQGFRLYVLYARAAGFAPLLRD